MKQWQLTCQAAKRAKPQSLHGSVIGISILQGRHLILLGSPGSESHSSRSFYWFCFLFDCFPEPSFTVLPNHPHGSLLSFYFLVLCLRDCLGRCLCFPSLFLPQPALVPPCSMAQSHWIPVPQAAFWSLKGGGAIGLQESRVGDQGADSRVSVATGWKSDQKQIRFLVKKEKGSILLQHSF